MIQIFCHTRDIVSKPPICCYGASRPAITFNVHCLHNVAEGNREITAKPQATDIAKRLRSKVAL